jgi:hypothetical protein
MIALQAASPTEELARLRQLVKSLESGAKIIRGGTNVTERELAILKREIVYLEKLVEGSGDSNS